MWRGSLYGAMAFSGKGKRFCPRQVAQFHTPHALAELLQRDFDAACDKARNTPNAHPLIRPYQTDANEETEKAIAGRKRQMLLAMATGTGKTFTLVNQIFRLMEAGVAKRILFLVDRRALAAQNGDATQFSGSAKSAKPGSPGFQNSSVESVAVFGGG